jgi:NF-kappa-B inhibitor zeta
MIVDKLLDDSRGGEGLLDAAGDCGLMTSPLNLAYFYGASPPAAAPGVCDAGCSSSGPSAPGSPGSDSSDFSSASSVSSCGAVEARARGGARAERPPGTHPPGSTRPRAPVSSGSSSLGRRGRRGSQGGTCVGQV